MIGKLLIISMSIFALFGMGAYVVGDVVDDVMPHWGSRGGGCHGEGGEYYGRGSEEGGCHYHDEDWERGEYCEYHDEEFSEEEWEEHREDRPYLED